MWFWASLLALRGRFTSFWDTDITDHAVKIELAEAAEFETLAIALGMIHYKLSWSTWWTNETHDLKIQGNYRVYCSLK